MKKRRWTQSEIAILKLYYGILSVQDIAKLLNRSVKSIYVKAFRLGLKIYGNNNIKVKRNVVPKYLKDIIKHRDEKLSESDYKIS